MAQNVTIAGASYSSVPAVDIPKTGGGSARFVDTTDANATAANISLNKTAYVNGSKLTGTAALTYNSSTEELTMPSWSVIING